MTPNLSWFDSLSAFLLQSTQGEVAVVEDMLAAVVAAVVLGIFAQVIAHRFKLPAILPLLLLGMAAGPFGLGFFDPRSLGHALEVILHLGVALILFEGSLSLDLVQVRQVGSSLRNLLTVGAAVTGAGAAVLAHFLIDMSWPTAALFGAIVTVTGPTVITPLLRHMVAPRKARTLLASEGLMIDPIGALLAYLVLQWIERSDLGFQAMLQQVFSLGIYGTVVGGFGAVLAVMALRRRFVPQELRSLVTLAILFGCFFLSEHLSKQSGILASVVMGIIVGGAQIPDLSPLKAFKGQLTVLFISVLFVLLSGQLDLSAMASLGWRGGLVVVGLILLVRPLSVFVSIPPSVLDIRERLLLALTAPRGIVAAAVASLSAIALRATGHAEDAARLEGLVYLVILATCTWATIMASWLPRWLGYYGDPSRRRLVLVGANEISTELAQCFRRRGWTVVVVDSSSQKLAPLREQNILTVSGDARDVSTYDKAGVERDCRVLAATPNDELNLLIAELVRDEFEVEHPVVVLRQVSDEFGSVRQAYIDLLSNDALALTTWNVALAEGKALFKTLDLPPGDDRKALVRDLLSSESEKYCSLVGWADSEPHFGPLLDRLGRLDRLTLLMRKEAVAALERALQTVDPPVEESVTEDENTAEV